MTANHVIDALRAAHSPPEWVFLCDVANGTGDNISRRADAIAMNMWPSRGLEIRGFEVKVSRADLKSELKTPEKADAIARFCDTWWLATPAGLVKDSEVPLAWGLIEVSVKNDVMNARIKKQAIPNDSRIEPSRNFVAAMSRAAAADADKLRKTHIPIDSISDKLRAEYTRGVAASPFVAQREIDSLRDKLKGAAVVLSELGINLDSDDWRDRMTVEVGKRHAAAIKLGTAMLEKYGEKSVIADLTREMTRCLANANTEIQRVIDDMEEIERSTP